MSVRALIIAIESYPHVNDGSIAAELPGTLQAGVDFRDWLINKWDAEGIPPEERQLLFCSNPVQPGGSDATDEAILEAVLALCIDGQNATPELYVFFSGHGFSSIRFDGSSDILITANYKSMKISGRICLNLDHIVFWLRRELGPGRHYYFIDACRTSLSNHQIVPAGSTLPSSRETSGEASTYVLQSTAQGEVASSGGAFSDALLAGLKGRGTAKIWHDTAPDTMLVRYDRLRAYMKDTLKTQRIYSSVQGTDGESDGVLAVLTPAPIATCAVRLDGGEPGQSGVVTCVGQRNATPVRVPLTGQTAEVGLKPDRYTVSVAVDGALHSRSQQIELYDDTTLTFPLSAASPSESAETPPDAALSEIIVPAGTNLELRDVLTGVQKKFRHGERIRVPPGRYRATVLDGSERVLKRDELDITEGAVIDVADWQRSAPHRAIAKFLPPPRAGGLDFSESLGGPVMDPDLDIWLAIVGGGRILGAGGRETGHDDYSKIERFPLHDFFFDDTGVSPIYVLAGFEDTAAQLAVGVSSQKMTLWTSARTPARMPGIKECLLPVDAGPQLVSFRLGDDEPYTIASLTSFGRATLITLTAGQNRQLIVGQYLLPMGHLTHMLHPAVADRLDYRKQLSDMLRLAQLERAFRNRRDVDVDVRGSELDAALYGKWIDPISTSLAAYELIRRGQSSLIDRAARNMLAYFPELPDSSALSALNNQKKVRYTAPPLFLDGLRAFSHVRLPFPAAKLDYNSPWTAWRGVV